MSDTLPPIPAVPPPAPPAAIDKMFSVVTATTLRPRTVVVVGLPFESSCPSRTTKPDPFPFALIVVFAPTNASVTSLLTTVAAAAPTAAVPAPARPPAMFKIETSSFATMRTESPAVSEPPVACARVVFDN